MRYWGKINVENLHYLRDYSGPGIIIANHQSTIDLVIPIIWNTLLHRNVYSLAASFAFQNRWKYTLSEWLNIIKVATSLSRDELIYLIDKLGMQFSEEEIEEAYVYYLNLSLKNKKAFEKIDDVLARSDLIFTFSEPFNPCGEMESASKGIGYLIARYAHIPVFPVSIIDHVVEHKVMNEEDRDLKRLDRLVLRKRKHFTGMVNLTVHKPMILQPQNARQPCYKEIIDEIMGYISLHLPLKQRGYYQEYQFDGTFNYFTFFEESRNE